MYGLNLYLSSFKFDEGIIDSNDKILISVTTVPEEMKEAILIKPSQMNNTHNSFIVNITQYTKEVCFVFWKKSLLQNDLVIGSTLITSNLFPKSFKDNKNKQTLTFDILEPMHHDQSQKRKVIGKMNLEFTLTEPYFPPDFDAKKLGHQANCKENPISNIWFTDNAYIYN